VPKCLLLTDFKPAEDWPFSAGFEEGFGEKPDVHYCVSNWLRTNIWLKVKRYLLYFTFPLSQLKYNGRYDAIIGYQQFYALNLVFFMKLLGIKKKSKVFVMTFIYKEKRGLLGRLYKSYIKSIVNSRYLDGLFVYSRGEVEFYSRCLGCDPSKFTYVHLGIGELPTVTVNKGDYCFSAGRSNRDYTFLCRAFKNLPYRLLIATDLAIDDAPDNVEVLGNCYGQKMLDYMAGAFCVIIPLDNQFVSSGQLVVLQAMQMRKPVIVTRSGGIADYIKDGETGLIMDNTEESLAASLARLSDPAEYERLARNAGSYVHDNCSQSGRGKTVGEYVAHCINN